jgi:hypothetical protein
LAAVSISRRATAGIVFIVAGALLLIALALPLLGVGSLPWLVALAYLAIAIAFAILGIGAVNSTLAKVMLVAAAIGWLILAINALVPGIPAVLVTIAALVAGIAGLIAAIVLYVGKEIRNLPALIFIITTALGLLYLLGPTLGLGTFGTVVAVLFAIGLIVTGVLFRQPERGRR